MDGTLIDSAEQHAQAFTKTLKQAGYGVEEQDFIRYFGMAATEIIRKTVPGLPEEKILGVLRKKDEEYRKKVESGEVKLKPGVKKTLQKLKKKGFTLCIASSDTRKNLETDVQKLGIKKYFTTITSAQDVTRLKPHPEQLFTTARKAGVKPEDCTLVGDTEYDVQAGKNAGMKTVILTGTLNKEQALKTGADRIISNMEELVK